MIVLQLARRARSRRHGNTHARVPIRNRLRLRINYLGIRDQIGVVISTNIVRSFRSSVVTIDNIPHAR